MLDGALSERYNMMQQNRYENTSTLARSFISGAIAAPLIDSYALNSYSHGTWSKFKFGLDNGIYNNHTFMGSSVFGGAYEKMLKLKPGTSKMFGGKFTTNFIKGDYSGTGINAAVGENMIEKGFGFSRNHADFFKRMNDAGFADHAKLNIKKEVVTGTRRNTNAIKNVTKTKSEFINIKNNIDKFSNAVTPEDTKQIIGDFFEKIAARNPDDIIAFQQDAMKSGMKFKNTLTVGASKEAVETATSELSEAVYKNYFTKSTAQEIMGHPITMTMTGAGNIGGKLGFGLNIAGAVVGAMSNMHQESMIQSTMNMENFNLIRGENLMNDRTGMATYSNQRASMSNEQDLSYVLSTRNIAEHYRRDAAEPEIDRTKSKKENFTIY